MKKHQIALCIAFVILMALPWKPMNPELAAARNAEKVKAEKDKKLAAQVENALHVCQRDQIKAQLNDPESYRLHDYKPVFLDDEMMIVNIEYSAKNAFGGRVRSNHRCAYRFS